jgi:Wadjet anti plasmid transformation system JetA-like protein
MTETTALAARFEEAVLADVGHRKRIALIELEDAFDEATPELRHRPERRRRLASAIAEVAARGTWTASVKHETGEQPPLPAFVTIGDLRAVPKEARIRDRVWRPELAWVANEPLTDAEEATLRAVHEWLRTRPTEWVSVPHRERSFQLFGDEKELDRLARGRLFSENRLTYELLRCVFVPPPIAQVCICDTPTCLVVENSATYATLLRHTAYASSENIGVLAYGAGRAFVQSVASLHDDLTRIERLLYFGDVDADGLAIPIGAAAAAMSAGLPAPEPAVVLYELLLDVGLPRSAPRNVSDEVAEELVAWLPPHLRDRAAKLLVAGERLAQEAVGRELMDIRRPAIA